MELISAMVGEDEQFLFWPEVLEADGWEKKSEGWRVPPIVIPVEEPPSKT